MLSSAGFSVPGSQFQTLNSYYGVFILHALTLAFLYPHPHGVILILVRSVHLSKVR